MIHRIPGLGERALFYAKRHVLAFLAKRNTPQRLEELRRADHPMATRLSSVLRRISVRDFSEASDWSNRIERERFRLLRDHSLLPAGEGIGPYDSGVTVSRACRASRRPRDALALFLLVRELAPKRVIELGTNIGVSSAYIAAAMQEVGSGSLITLEASPGRMAVARKLHQGLGLTTPIEYVVGLFNDTLDAALSSPVDFAFVDGHHQYEPTLDYFERIWRHSTENAVFLFDDIRWSRGMERAWRQLRSEPRLPLAIDLGGLGLCVSTRHPGAGTRLSSSMITI